MTNDDLTQKPTDQVDDKATQPTITAVFRLLQDIDKRFNGRFDGQEGRFEALENRIQALENRIQALENRVDQLETRIARDFAAVDARFVELANEMKNGFIQLGDKLADQMDHLKLHHDADYQDLLRRMRRLESNPA